MGVKNPLYPSYAGLAGNRETRLQDAEPDFRDWDQIVAEVLNLQALNATQTRQLMRAKVGGTAGWVLGAANDLPYLATMAASQAAGTLVIPVEGLRIGDVITGFKINAQVESGGNAVTIDAALRAVTNVAADPTDAAIGSGMTQVSVTADTAVAGSKTGLTEVVTSGKSYYILVTATTLGSTDIILQACEVMTSRPAA